MQHSRLSGVSLGIKGWGSVEFQDIVMVRFLRESVVRVLVVQ